MQKCLLIFPACFLVISCSPYQYEANSAKKPVWSENRPVIYVPDGKGGMKRDRRMERIQARGQQDNSTDGGWQSGW